MSEQPRVQETPSTSDTEFRESWTPASEPVSNCVKVIALSIALGLLTWLIKQS